MNFNEFNIHCTNMYVELLTVTCGLETNLKSCHRNLMTSNTSKKYS